MHTRAVRMRAFGRDEHLAPLRDARVLLYFPHGFGDWVQVSYVLPLLAASNRIWLTRFGDDYSSVLDGCASATPLYMGSSSVHCGDGESFGMRHFGALRERLVGHEIELRMPLPLAAVCAAERIDTFVWPPLAESHGHVPFPHHTKARALWRRVDAGGALARPLKSAISFAVPRWIEAWVEARLQSKLGLDGARLCVIGRNGYTSVGKNWGHLWREDLPPGQQREGEECRQLMRALKRHDPRWRFVIMEDRAFTGEHTVRDPELPCLSYAELFGEADESSLPFGLVLKALLRRAALFIGVPAGPYHLAMALPELPTIGLWTEHLPSWYDEPKEASLHVISRNVREHGFDARPGSFSARDGFEFRARWLDTRIIAADAVLAAARELVG